jgi:hypothetical protein
VHAGWCGRGASSGRPLSRSLNLDLALPERSSGWQSYENARPSHIIHNCS